MRRMNRRREIFGLNRISSKDPNIDSPITTITINKETTENFLERDWNGEKENKCDHIIKSDDCAQLQSPKMPKNHIPTQSPVFSTINLPEPENNEPNYHIEEISY